MCVNEPQCELQTVLQTPAVFGNKMRPHIKPGCPTPRLGFCLSTQTVWDTCQWTQIPPHKVGGLFSLHVACSESLKRSCQQGKSPILQLCPQRDYGDSRLHYLDFFRLWLWRQKKKKTATRGEKDQANSGNVQNFAADWTRRAIIWATSMEINAVAYITGPQWSYFTFNHLSHTSDKNFSIDFTLAPPPPVLLQSPSIDTQIYSKQERHVWVLIWC